MIIKITGKDNKKIKFIKSLEKKNNREKYRKFVVEGKRIVEEALKSALNYLECIVVSELFLKKNQGFYKYIDKLGKNVYIVIDSVFNSITQTETPQGILAVMNMPKQEDINIDDCFYVMILDGISEPGNMGTIIRTAEAAGVDLIYTMFGSVDIYNPKVVRSTMGSIFRIKVLTGKGISDITKLKDNGFSIIATSLENSKSIEDVEVAKRRAIVIGSEANGVSADILSLSDIRVRIDMQGEVESLNAAVAAGIVMYKFKNSML